jgi:CheY-like chemotaxis protein
LLSSVVSGGLFTTLLCFYRIALHTRIKMTTFRHILVVEDEPKILFVVGQALERLSPRCTVDTCSKSLDALKMAQTTRCDLVITALRMPDLDGIALTEALRSLPYDPIVIWMTAYDCCTVREDARRLGVHRCLDKPLEVIELRRIVREALWGVLEPTPALTHQRAFCDGDGR